MTLESLKRINAHIRPMGWVGLALALGMIAGTLLAIPPIYQDPSYHQFADTRSLLGIPHFWNVVSNLSFLLVGLWGFTSLQTTGEQEGRWPWSLFFGSVMVLALGSSSYHLSPTNGSLLLDRVPMVMAFVGLLAASSALHFSRKGTGWVLVLSALIGAAGLWTWTAGPSAGGGDLRLYGLTQFGGTGLAMFWLLTSALNRKAKAWCLLACLFYTMAKVMEWVDIPVYVHSSSWISGHTLKHFLAAVSIGCFIPVSKSVIALGTVFKGVGREVSGARPRAIWARAWVLLLVVCSVFLIGQREALVSRLFLYPFPCLSSEDVPKGVTRVSVPTSDGLRLEGWWLEGRREPQQAKGPVLLFLHGNAGNLHVQWRQFEYLAPWGYDVLALDYRGFGRSEGRADRKGMVKDGLAALDYLERECPGRKTIVVGHSMGTVIAMQLAARDKRVSKLVVMAPFTRFTEVGEWALRHWGMSPLVARLIAGGLIPSGLDPILAASSSALPPVLMVHGTMDPIVPFEMGRRVYKAYRGKKDLLIMEGYGHMDFFRGPRSVLFKDSMVSFFRR